MSPAFFSSVDKVLQLSIEHPRLSGPINPNFLIQRQSQEVLVPFFLCNVRILRDSRILAPCPTPFQLQNSPGISAATACSPSEGPWPFRATVPSPAISSHRTNTKNSAASRIVVAASPPLSFPTRRRRRSALHAWTTGTRILIPC